MWQECFNMHTVKHSKCLTCPWSRMDHSPAWVPGCSCCPCSGHHGRIPRTATEPQVELYEAPPTYRKRWQQSQQISKIWEQPWAYYIITSFYGSDKKCYHSYSRPTVPRKSWRHNNFWFAATSTRLYTLTGESVTHALTSRKKATFLSTRSG